MRSNKLRLFLLGAAAWIGVMEAAEPPAIIPSSAAGRLSPQIVKAALEKGCAYLAELLGGDDSAPSFGYALGSRALYAAALLSAGHDPAAPLIRQLYQRMASLPFKRVYSASLYAIALDCRFKRLAGSRQARMGRTARAELARAVNWVVRAQGRQCGAWAYFPIRRGSRFDLSNTQFAVLALGVGHRHGVEIPREVTDRFVKACLGLSELEDGEHRLEITSQVDWLKPQKGSRTRSLRGRPRGWRYGPTAAEPYFAMTAATVGNLIVARQLLARGGRGLDHAIDGGFLWLDRHWDELLKRHKRPGRRLTGNYYYTVWSLEKACDLGEIALLGDRDWYGEEARFLIGNQNENGSWGEGQIRPVATAFALLFLARAQAARPLVTSAPCLFTGPGAAGDRDRVYVRQIQAYVSARGFLSYLAAAGEPKLLRLAESVVRAYPVGFREDLIPQLCELLDTRSSRIRRFADRELKKLTGLSNLARDKVDAWYRTYSRIVKAEKENDPDGLAACLESPLSANLLDKLLRVIEKLKARSFVPVLVDRFSALLPELRPRLHRTLCFLTGQRIPYDPQRSEAFWRSYVRGSKRAESGLHRIGRVQRLPPF